MSGGSEDETDEATTADKQAANLVTHKTSIPVSKELKMVSPGGKIQQSIQRQSFYAASQPSLNTSQVSHSTTNIHHQGLLQEQNLRQAINKGQIQT